MSSGKPALTAALVMLSFLVVAAIQSWPLPLHLTTHLTGSPGGDTGVYVWNTWVFGHELRQHQWPLWTDTVFGLSGPIDLSLHNYTVFSNLVALPLQSWLGVVGAFNVVYLLNIALAGLGTFLLIRHVGRGWSVSTRDAWLAAVLFACSPFLVARSTAHFSLVAAAPLPFFALYFDRMWQSHRVRDALAAGACVAWAAYCDAYYAVYCVLIAGALSASRIVTITLRRRLPAQRWFPALDVPILLLLATIIGASVAAGGVLRVGTLVVSMRTLYTPVLLLTVLVAARAWWMLRPTVHWSLPPTRPTITAVLTMGLTASVLLGPVLYAVALRAIDGRMVNPPVLWRSSAPGVDLLSFVAPNPNHPLAPEALVRWVGSQPGRYEENVASIPWIALMVLLVAYRKAAYRPDRGWLLVLVFFMSVAVGPFIRIAGINTHIPTPWTLLRYVPVIGEARMPPRFSVIVALAVAVLFAGALAAMRQRWPRSGHTLAVVIPSLLLLELWSAPRQLHAANVPTVFESIAMDRRPVRVLSLPFGIRDGLSSLGDFSAWTLFYQTYHGKGIVGGYVSRVSQPRKDRNLADPVAAALILASEGSALTESQRAAARDAGPAFVERAALGWVVIDETKASPSLQEFAIEALRLRLKTRDGAFALYVPDGIEE
jgi:hypothetical protein